VAAQNCTTVPFPKAGEVISFTYENFAQSSIPIKPKIYRIRKDINWKDVVNSFLKDEKLKGNYNPIFNFIAYYISCKVLGEATCIFVFVFFVFVIPWCK
jgi:hypothetical protein